MPTIESNKISGIIQELKSDKIGIKTKDGLFFMFQRDKNTVMDQKLLIGNVSVVEFSGDLFKNPVAKKISKENPENIYMDGVVESFDQNLIVIHSSGQNYGFILDETSEIENTIHAGDHARVFYDGILGKVCFGIKIIKG